MEKSISIIGAGIGGLAMALVLKQKAIPCKLYESADEIKPVGAGIVMASNAMQIFDKQGIRHKIEQAGNRISNMKITDSALRAISTLDLSSYESKFGVHNVSIHRADLQKILANEIGLENIKLSKRLVSIKKEKDFLLDFEDGTQTSSNVVIAADGIKSVVRKQLFSPSTIRNSGQVCWRGLCEMDLPKKYWHDAVEAWGKGKRFGFVKLGQGKVYWYAVVNQNLSIGSDTDLNNLFQEFHTDVRQVISDTPKENIFFSEIIDLKPISTWQQKNVCLLGDAAHATTPNMGQGACQAVEDAYAIGELFAKGKTTDEVFALYENIRLKKAYHIVNSSWRLGKISHFENALAIWFRNTSMRMLPASANKKQLGSIFDISYINKRIVS